MQYGSGKNVYNFGADHRADLECFPLLSWAAVAEGVEWSSSNLKVGNSIPSLPKNICMLKCP